MQSLKDQTHLQSWRISLQNAIHNFDMILDDSGKCQRRPTLLIHRDDVKVPVKFLINRSMPCSIHLLIDLNVNTGCSDFPLYGLDQPPATSTHSGIQLPSLPSTSTMSVSHLQRQPQPFSLTASKSAQYSSSSRRFFSSLVVSSK